MIAAVRIRIALVGLAAFLCQACAGPHVSVSAVTVTPSPIRGHARVRATVVNAGGQGDVRVTVRLRARDTGTIVGASSSIGIGAHERLDWVLDVAAPDGNYDPASVEASYPID